MKHHGHFCIFYRSLINWIIRLLVFVVAHWSSTVWTDRSGKGVFRIKGFEEITGPTGKVIYEKCWFATRNKGKDKREFWSEIVIILSDILKRHNKAHILRELQLLITPHNHIVKIFLDYRNIPYTNIHSIKMFQIY